MVIEKLFCSLNESSLAYEVLLENLFAMNAKKSLSTAQHFFHTNSLYISQNKRLPFTFSLYFLLSRILH